MRNAPALVRGCPGVGSVGRVGQLVVSCVVLGIGVAVLLRAALGSDGYSTLVNGLSLSLDVPFLAVNCVLGVVLVAMAWWRGLIPGIGTVVQPVVVGATVTVTMDLVTAPHALAARIGLLVAAFAVLAFGVAGYLGSPVDHCGGRTHRNVRHLRRRDGAVAGVRHREGARDEGAAAQ